MALQECAEGAIDVAVQAAGGADGAVGNVSQNTNDDLGSHEFYYGQYTASASGTISYIHVYLGWVATISQINCGIYDVSEAKLRDGTHVHGNADAVQWYHIPLDSPLEITNGTTYFLAFWTDDASFTIGYLSDQPGDNLWYGDTTISDIDIMPANTVYTGPIVEKNMAIYADNNPT